VQDEEWLFYERFRAIERMGPRALFALAALDIGGHGRALEAIVERARPAPIPWDWDDEAITRAAEQIDATEDAALTDWLAPGQWQLPAWFRREALRVTLVVMQPPLTPLAHLSFRFWHAAGIFPELQTRAAAKKIITAAFTKELQTFLDQTYREHPFDRREMGRARAVYRHFEWAVRVILKEETFKGIADAEGKAHQSVNEAVHKIAELIGVTLNLHAGRPGGQGN